MVSKRKRKNEPKGGRRRSKKEHDRDIRLARTETSAVSEHAHNTGHKPLWSVAKFIDRDPYYYTRRVRKAIHIRLHPNNINRDSGIEIPEAWILTIKCLLLRCWRIAITSKSDPSLILSSVVMDVPNAPRKRVRIHYCLTYMQCRQ